MTAPPMESLSRPNEPAFPGHRRRLRNYLIDRRFQLRYTLVMVAITVALTASLGALVYYFVREASQVVAVRAMDPGDTQAIELQRQLLRADRWLLAGLIGLGVLLSLATAAYGIVLTHRVAGPLFKLTFYMNRIREGQLGQIFNLRRGDQLVDFFAAFKQMHEALVARTREDIAVLDQAILDAENANQEELVNSLRKHRRSKAEFLG